jgi:membrane protein DedA with SNARE-associated domain
MIEQVMHYLNHLISVTTNPIYLMLIVIAISFLFEDIAAAAGVGLASSGMLNWIESFAAVALGIALGDILLYGLGSFCQKIPSLKKRYIDGKDHHQRLKSIPDFATAIFLSRVTPGLRLATYIYMGFVRVSFVRYLFWVSIAVLIWTASLYVFSHLFGSFISVHFGVPIGLATALPLLTLAMVTFVFTRFFKKQNPTHET